MYSYSHESNSGWMGTYEHPQQALAAGRAAYGGDTRIFVGRWKSAMYSDMFIGAKTLLSYMKEDAAVKCGDEHVEVFDNLPEELVQKLDQYIATCIGEWESELPDDLVFTGMHIEMVRGYSENEEVRPMHFKR